MGKTRTVKAGNAEVAEWLERQTNTIAQQYGEGSDAFNDALAGVHRRYLSIHEFRFQEMMASDRYTLPPATKRTIIQFQRRHGIMDARDREIPLYSQLYVELGLQDPDTTVLPQFLKLCRRKVDIFVKNNGIAWIRDGVVRKTPDGLQWEPWTQSWLDVHWDGSVIPPYCRLCGHTSISNTKPSLNSEDYSRSTEILKTVIMGLRQHYDINTWLSIVQPLVEGELQGYQPHDPTRSSMILCSPDSIDAEDVQDSGDI
jgi:hypothetical protein